MAAETTVDPTQTVSDLTQRTLMMSSPRQGERMTFSNLTKPHLKDYCPASNLALNEKVKQLMKEGKKVYHFAFGQAPFPIPQCMTDALKEFAGEKAYLPVAGIPELRDELCKFHSRYDNMSIDRDQIIVAPGSKELIFLLMTVFNGDVLVLSPTWTTYKPQSQLAHNKSYIVPSNAESAWRVTPQAIQQTVAKNNLAGNLLLIFCNPDNPTGASYTADQLRDLAEVCRRNRIIVLSDEIYGRLRYDQCHDTIARYYPEGTIVSTGFSKWASAGGWRLGYHVYPPELYALRDAVNSGASHSYSCAPAPMQYAVAKALGNRDEIDEYIKHTTRVLATLADYCHRELTSVGVQCEKSTAGYYIFPNFEVLRGAFNKRGITTCSQMCDAMFDEVGVALMAGGPAFLRPVDEFTTRLCYVNFDGKDALVHSREIGLATPLGEDFLQKYCNPAYDGIKAITHWCLKQLKEYS